MPNFKTIGFLLICQCFALSPLSAQTLEQQLFHNPKTMEVFDTALAHSLNYTFQFAPKDKQLHYAAGALIATTSTSLARLYYGKSSRLKSSLIGFSAALLAGIGKEIYDSQHNGTVDAADAFYTALSGAFFSIRINF